MDRIDYAIIGAGVAGLAIARTLSANGHEVIILEAENAFGIHTSARNSEVIHAGISYAPGSLKGKLCVAGKQTLYAYRAERDGDLQPGYTGIRPRLAGPGSSMHNSATDFIVQDASEHGIPGLLNLFGIESPGLTASLAIGEYVGERVAALAR